MPWPSGPVVDSTPGIQPNSGWPGVFESLTRKFFTSSRLRSKPAMCSHEYRNIEPWPAERMKRSRLIHDGTSGLYDISWPYRHAPISAQPRGKPMWPDLALEIESMASPRASSAALASATGAATSASVTCIVTALWAWTIERDGATPAWKASTPPMKARAATVLYSMVDWGLRGPI